MAIYNNAAMKTLPVHSGNVLPPKKKAVITTLAEIAPVSQKVTNKDFSLVLSTPQQKTINDTLGYDKPSAKGRGALNAYHQVATQEKRDQIMATMSFHFVV